jgi:hypothetical protein
VGTVTEYVEQFSTPVNQLVPYETDSNPLYYDMRFVDGLHDGIRSMVMIQRPATLESACALALVQEEAGDYVKKKEYMRYEPSSNTWLISLHIRCHHHPKMISLVGPLELMIAALLKSLVLIQSMIRCALSSSIVVLVDSIIIVRRGGHMDTNVLALYNCT